jgi:uncharacterized phosphosugar-binding protein
MKSATEWLGFAAAVLDRIGETQSSAIEAASEACATTIAAGRLVHVFGAGHSRIPVEEMFPRYGSYPGFHPIAELSLTFHTQVVGSNGQRQAMYLESVSGLAEVILANFDVDERDAVMIFSASGIRAVPVEMAVAARTRGATVVGITSVAQSRAGEPTNVHGERLCDAADICIDLCTPAADAVVTMGNGALVGPTTSIAAVAVANMIKVRAYELLLELGIDLPVITSPTAVGAERSAELFDAAYGVYARRFAAVLDGGEHTP